MSEESDNGALLADGIPVTLANGEERKLVIDNRTMIQIETQYGSMIEFLRTIRTTPMKTLIWLFSRAFKVSESKMIDLIDSRRIREYAEAVSNAACEALGIDPKAKDDEGEGEGEGLGEADRLPGADSISPLSSAGTSRPPSSGG